MNKKLVASVLAMAMTVGMVVPAFAGDSKTFESTVSANGAAKNVTIHLNVPTSQEFELNPYKLEATVYGKAVSDNVIADTYSIENKSEVAVQVDILNVVADGGKWATTTDAKGKEVGYFPITIVGSQPTGDWKKTKSAHLFIQWGKTKSELDTVNKKQIVNATQNYTKEEKKKLDGGKKLKAFTLAKDGADGNTMYMKLKGEVNANAKKPGTTGKTSDDYDKWSEADKLSVSYKLVMTPVVPK